jgi:hypothetical protein
MKLTEKLEVLMSHAAKTWGLKDPIRAASIIEEDLTPNEYDEVLKFFTYCSLNNLGFGPANIQERWNQAQKSGKKGS